MKFIITLCLFVGCATVPSGLWAQSAQDQLWDAAVTGDTVMLRDAISRGARVDSLDTRTSRNGRRALNWAALNNRVPAIRVLLAAGANMDSTNLTGFTALHHAAESGSLDAAQALLEAGADPRRMILAGYTAAQIARARGYALLADLLDAAMGGGGHR